MDALVKKQTLFSDRYLKRRVLVTGHTGFKGSWLCLWLDGLGAEVAGYANGRPTDPCHLDLLRMNVNEYEGDVRDFEALRDCFHRFRPEMVFHLAAQPIVRRSFEDPLETYSTNVMGTVNVLEACREQDSVAAAVIVTSDKCYRNYEGSCSYGEADPLGGDDPYSCSKGCAELVTASYRKAFFERHASRQIMIATARAGNVLGGGDWGEDRLVPDIVKALVAGRPAILRNPAAIRPWQHVLDLIPGYLLLGQRLLEGKTRFADAWNFGPRTADRPWSVEELATDIGNLLHTQICHEKKNEDLPETQILWLDTSKAREALPWKPLLTLAETTRLTAEWYAHYYQRNDILSRRQLEDYIRLGLERQADWAL